MAKLRSRKQIERAWAKGQLDYQACPPKHEMGGEAKFLWGLVHLLGTIVLPMVVAAGLVYLFVWAGMSMLPMCLGTAPLWATCLLIFALAYVYPYFFGRKHK